MPGDPARMSWRELDAELVGLQRTYRCASHEISSGFVPDGIDQQTLSWWRRALEVRERLVWDLPNGPS